MKKRYVRIVTFMVAFGILLSMAGCAGKVPADEKLESTTVGQAQETKQSGTQDTDVKKEAVTLRIYSPTASTPIATGLQDDPVAKEIERVTGVSMDYEVASDANKTKVIVASGDLADITVIGDMTFIEPLIKAGSILELDKYVENAPNINKNAGKAVKYSKDVLSSGTGKLYVLPMRAKQKASPVADDYDGLFLRWDYYKEIGSPEIKNVDDLVSVVLEMVKKHPTNPDGKKNYGFQTWLDWGLWGYYYNYYGTKYSGLTTAGSFGNYNMNTNEYISLMDDRNHFWKAAEMFNKANRAGILDPESFTQKFENAQEKSKTGRILCQFQEWMVQDANAALSQSTSGKAVYVDVPMPDTAEYTAWYDRSAPFGYTARLCVISSKCKTPEKAVELLDYLYSEEGARNVFTGVKGRTWSDQGGKAMVTEECLNSIKADPEFKVKEGIHKYESIIGLDYDALAENGQFLDLFLEPDIALATYTPAEKEYCQYYSATNKLEVISKRQNKGTINLAISSLMPVQDSDMTRIKSKIENYLLNEMPRLITAKDDTAFKAQKDKMFNEIKKLDYEKLDAFDKDGFKKSVESFSNY